MRKLVSIKEIDRFPLYDITVENDHCFELFNGVIAHNSLYPKNIVSGGTGLYYSSNQIFIVSKAQEKDGDQLAGFKYTINIEKSRYVREKAKLPFTVLYNKGIMKWSALFDLAQESGHIIKPKMGWYQTVDMETGEVSEKSYRAKDLEYNDAYFQKLIKDQSFKDFIEKKYKLNGGPSISAEDPDGSSDEETEDDAE